MTVPLIDIQSIGAPVETEQIATSTSVAYSDTVYERGEVLKLVGTDGHEVEFVPEYNWLANLGSEWYENPTTMWASEDEDAELSGYSWRLGSSATSARFTLDRTGGTISKSHVLEVALDGGTDDEIRIPLMKFGPLSSIYRAFPYQFPASLALQLEIRHIESDAGVDGLQYQLRQELKTPTYWNGTIWTTETWIDVSVSATEASFTDAITLDSSPSTYTLALRNKGTNASETSHVSRISVHETLTAGEGARLSANEPTIYVMPYRGRIAAIADNASKKLFVSRLGNQRYS